MTLPKQKPAETLRDGAIKATIWRNQSEKGPFYSVEFSRTYKTAEGFQESNSFSGSDILKVQSIALRAYDYILALRGHDAIQAKNAIGSGA